jgi:F-type H+-transporting ATPase subunit b
MNSQTLIIISQILTQVLAFLIFLWILKRFAWGPIVGLLDERRAAIAQEFERLDRRREEAEKLRADYEGRLRAIEAEGRERIQEAVNEGRRVAQEIRQRAHDEAREITNKAKQNIQLEIDKARLQLKGEIVCMTISALERVLRQSLDREKHERLIRDFIETAGKG